MNTLGFANQLTDFLQGQIKEADKSYAELIKVRKRFKDQPEMLALCDENEDKLNLAVGGLRKSMAHLRTSVKFRLPYGAILFEPEEGDTIETFAKRMCGDFLNLPYEKTTIEYEDDEGIRVILYEDDGDCIRFRITTKDHDALEGNRDKDLEFVGCESEFRLSKQDYTIYLDENSTGIHENASTASIANVVSILGVGPLLQLICALNCSNVSVQDDKENAPSKNQQAKRRAKGKLPLYTYKVLTINSHKGSTTVDTESTGEGSGRQVRSHLRRGHIRKYKTGLQIWINSMAVGLKSNGEVEKSYNVV